MADRASADPVSAGSGMDRRQALRITAVAGIAAAFGGGLTAGVLRQLGLRRVSETRSQMGTVVTMTVFSHDAAEARSWITDAFAEMERLEALLSRHRSGTPVASLNASGRLDDAPPELVEVLAAAGRMSDVTGGAFDVTVAPLLSLYERSFAERAAPPSDGELARALELVDYRGLRVENGRVMLQAPGMAITLDGIAKGYIVDRTTSVLAERGAERVMVNAGGDIATVTTGSSDEPWTVGIQDPHTDGMIGLLGLGGDCIATSGDYMSTFSDDRRFHHIIDPRTGRSPEETSSVSVMAATAFEADALSTALLVLGPAEGLQMLEARTGVEGMIVTKDGRQVRSGGLGRRLV